MSKRQLPEVNAGSMADIAFLLLIFFLVTTTLEADSGISRKLPPIMDDVPIADIKKKNLFVVEINKSNELLVEEEIIELSDLKELAIAFLDNGGGVNDAYCEYCQGAKDSFSSDNPEKAIISLRNDRETSYAVYIAVQNELVAAYSFLRNREAKRIYSISFEDMIRNYEDVSYTGNRLNLKNQIEMIKKMYPEKLSEALPIN